MELRKGYKQTECGLLPDDWQIFSVRDLIDLLTDYDANGSFASVAENVKSYDFEEYAWYVRSTDLENNASMNKVKYVDEPSYKFLKKTSLFGGELLFLKRGDIGNVYLFEMKTQRATVAPNLYLLKLNNISNSKYLYYYFTSVPGSKQLKSKNASSTLGALYKDDVKNILVPLPPTKAEQTAIANALSDADALISSLGKLIEKKRNIKQGAMQQLLKPKKGWVEMSILQLADNKKELFDDGDWIESEHITTEGIRLIQTGNIGLGDYVEKETRKYINEASFKSIRCKELRIGDLLICRLAEPAGRACILPDIGEYKVVTSVDVTIFRPREDLVNRIFLVNIFSTNKWLEAISGMSGGTTHKRISRGALGRTKIYIPSIDEQNRIAEILNDMDNEIFALEKKLSKSKSLKQGMMQELLTGKIRLV